MNKVSKATNEIASTFAYERMKEKTSYQICKRAMDILGAFVALVLFSPLFVIVGILIKTEDFKGGIFFSQTRVGKNGRQFKMYKFRSMVVNAEELLANLAEHNEVEGAMFKMKEDPRVTKIGKFIRKTSLDELPQLWNVLKGDMSLVGPRPPLVTEVEEYTVRDMNRLTVVPGCTGLWQVSGRSNLGFTEMVELDLEYIENRSLWYDIKIIFKTFKVLLGASDAY